MGWGELHKEAWDGVGVERAYLTQCGGRHVARVAIAVRIGILRHVVLRVVGREEHVSIRGHGQKSARRPTRQERTGTQAARGIEAVQHPLEPAGCSRGSKEDV